MLRFQFSEGIVSLASGRDIPANENTRPRIEVQPAMTGEGRVVLWHRANSHQVVQMLTHEAAIELASALLRSATYRED